MITSEDFILLQSKNFCQYFKSVSKQEWHKLHDNLHDNSKDIPPHNIEKEVNNPMHLQFKKGCSLNDSIHGEDTIECILNKLNPTCEVILNMHPHINCDFIIKNTGEPDILVENKSNRTNISKTIVDTFKESCKLQQSNGILMSQHSGIIGKSNFEIEFIGIYVVVYLCKNEYDEDKISIALDIIHKLTHIIRMINNGNNDISVSHNTLNEIKEEYQQLSSNKDHLYEFLTTVHSQIMHKLNKMTLLKTGEFLATKFTQVDNPKSHLCNLCNTYTSNTLKGMAAHKRGCKKRNNIVTHK